MRTTVCGGRNPCDGTRPGSYAVPDAATVHNVVYEWNHSLGAIVSSLIDHGLVVEFLHEHPFMLWRRWSFLVETEPGIWRLPAEYEASVALDVLDPCPSSVGLTRRAPSVQ